tara:strand:+ start:770 stop:1609 length:840 start_codon:yes stop_codon:yes gene_type:complete
MNPKFSTIIPFYNGEKTLSRAIESAIDQATQFFELILVNDGSEDNSLQVAKSFLGDSRISLHSIANHGVSAARNLGGAQAKGEWLLFLDADDQLRPGFFQILKEEIAQASHCDYLIFGINRIKEKQEEISLPANGHYFSRIPGTFVIKKSVFDQVGGYDERFKFSENTELFHRLALMGAKGKNIPWVSLNYYDNSSGGSKNLKNMVDSLSLFLDIHADTLSSHVKHLYHQIIGVNFLRFRMFDDASFNFRKSLSYKFEIRTFMRYLLSRIPLIARKIYK